MLENVGTENFAEYENFKKKNSIIVKASITTEEYVFGGFNAERASVFVTTFRTLPLCDLRKNTYSRLQLRDLISGLAELLQHLM